MQMVAITMMSLLIQELHIRFKLSVNSWESRSRFCANSSCIFRILRSDSSLNSSFNSQRWRSRISSPNFRKSYFIFPNNSHAQDQPMVMDEAMVMDDGDLVQSEESKPPPFMFKALQYWARYQKNEFNIWSDFSIFVDLSFDCACPYGKLLAGWIFLFG